MSRVVDSCVRPCRAAGVPHEFVNTGPGVLRLIEIHASDRLATDWLED